MSLPETNYYVPDGADVDSAIIRTTHLGIGAHPDDLEIMAYPGIENCWDNDEHWFSGIVVTDGAGSARGGPYENLSERAISDIRFEEQLKAADIGRYGFVSQYRLTSSMLQQDDVFSSLVERLTHILNRMHVQCLYLHNPVDRHPTHIRVLKACLQALKNMEKDSLPKHIYGMEVWRDLDWVSDDRKTCLRTDKYPDLSTRIIEVFDSQIASGKHYIEATLGRRFANATFANSHEVDQYHSCVCTLDLRPLVETDIPLSEFVDSLIQDFRKHALSMFEPKQYVDSSR